MRLVRENSQRAHLDSVVRLMVCQVSVGGLGGHHMQGIDMRELQGIE